MNKKSSKGTPRFDLLVALSSGIFAGAAIFEIIPESAKQLGWINAFLLTVTGFVIWYVLKLVTNKFSKNAFAISASLAIWFHSLLEGAITAVGLSIGGIVGFGIVTGMLLHLLPEFFAVVAILRSEGFSLKKSVMVDVITIIVLLVSFGITYYFLRQFSQTTLVALEAVSAGAFLYIAGHSLLTRVRMSTLVAATAGLAIMLLIRVVV